MNTIEKMTKSKDGILIPECGYIPFGSRQSFPGVCKINRVEGKWQIELAVRRDPQEDFFEKSTWDTKSGELVPDERYGSVVGVSSGGVPVFIDRVYQSFGGTFGSGWGVSRQQVREIIFGDQKKVWRDGTKCRVVIPIEWEALRRIRVPRDEFGRVQSVPLLLRRISALGRIVIEDDCGCGTVVTVSSESGGNLRGDTPEKIAESVSYAAGEAADWSVAAFGSGASDDWSVCYRSAVQGRSSVKGMLSDRMQAGDPESAFYLFDKYLKYSLETVGKYSGITMQYRRAQWSDGSMTETAMSVCAAVEALVRMFEFPQDRSLGQQISIGRLALENSEMDPGLARRAGAMLGGLTSMSMRSKIDWLGERLGYGKEFGDSFAKTRNRAMHGGEVSVDNDEVRHVDRLIELAHRLVADKIDYRGPYVAYSVAGYPEAMLDY